MKLRKKFFKVIILVIVILSIVFLIRPVDIIDYESENIDLSAKILNDTELDLYGQNTTTISEKELNNLVKEDIDKLLNDTLGKNIELENFYLDLQTEQLVLKTALKAGILPLGLNIYFDFIINDGNLALQIEHISLGKITIPEFIIQKNVNYSYLYYINDYDNSLDYINISQVKTFENAMQVTYTLNIEKVISSLIDESYQGALLSIVTSLDTDETSKTFANDLFIVFSKISKQEEVSDSLTNKLTTDFNNLALNQKAELFLTLLKYNLQTVIDLLA